MRHPVRDRFVMLLYALASLCASAVLIGMLIGKITPEMISGVADQLIMLPQRTVTICLIAGAAILILFGLALFAAMFPPKKKRSSNFAIQQNENGMVRISLKTIDALVSKCLNQHTELKVVSSSLFSDEETIRIDVHIALLTDISMPLAISTLQKQITKYVEACSGVNVKEVRVFVDGAMPGGEKAQQSRYALPASILGEESESAAEEKVDNPFADVLPAEPAAQETAVIEETPEAEDASAAEEAAVVEEAPAAEENPVVQEASAAEETPVVQEAPAAEETPVVQETSAAEETPVVEETPAAEETPVGEEAPSQEETPAVGEEAPVKKGLFGLFGRK